MADPIVPPTAPTSIVNTPPPTPTPAPESVLFKTTPGEPAPSAPSPAAPASGEPPVVAPTVPPAPVPEPKPPTEPIKPVAPVAPATPPTDYVLTLPENSLLSAEDLAATLKEAKDAGLSKDQAEKVLAMRNQTANASVAQVKAQQEKALTDAKVLWKSQVEKDPELGGEHLAETALLSSRGYAALATPEDKQFIEQLGLDHHPSFVRMMAKVGRLIGEDQRLILGSVGGAPAPDAPEKILYGKTTPDGKGQRST